MNRSIMCMQANINRKFKQCMYVWAFSNFFNGKISCEKDY